MKAIESASQVQVGAVTAPPPENGATQPTKLPEGFLDFAGLKPRVPYGDRQLREHIRLGHIPSIVLPGASKRLFFWPAVEAALLRFQRGGAE